MLVLVNLEVLDLLNLTKSVFSESLTPSFIPCAISTILNYWLTAFSMTWSVLTT